jgi:hypothetical protein
MESLSLDQNTIEGAVLEGKRVFPVASAEAIAF